MQTWQIRERRVSANWLHKHDSPVPRNISAQLKTQSDYMLYYDI